MTESYTTPVATTACTMDALAEPAARQELLNRLRRAEGQLRGIQRMVEEGQPCGNVAAQLSAVRKALDSTYVHMTMCFLQAELSERLGLDERRNAELDTLMQEVQALLGKAR